MIVHRSLLTTWLPLLLLASCSNVQQPLIFTSESNVGLDVAASPTDPQAVRINFGVKLRDFAFVPTTVTDTGGTVHNVRGCFRQQRGNGELSNCEGGDVTGSTPVVAPLAPKPAFYELPQRALLQPTAVAPVLPASPPTGSAGTPTDRSLALPATGAPGRESIIDSLSTYSSFDSKSSATASAQTTAAGASAPQANAGINVNLGKVFATGVAAQQLTEGQNYYLQLMGLGARADSVANCIAAAQKAAGANATLTVDQQLALCGSK
jgi:hypothetical protein